MDAEAKRWLEEILPRNREGIESNAFFLQLWNEKILEDPAAVLQTGLAVLLNKPMYFVVPPGMRLPENLQRLARGVLLADMSTEEGRKSAADWLTKMMVKEPA